MGWGLMRGKPFNHHPFNDNHSRRLVVHHATLSYTPLRSFSVNCLCIVLRTANSYWSAFVFLMQFRAK
jgi:hypothetical protein